MPAVVLLAAACLALPTRCIAGPYTFTQSGTNTAAGKDFKALGTNFSSVVSAQITSGKANKILVIEMTVADSDSGGGVNTYYFYPEVNGVNVVQSRAGISYFEAQQSTTGQLVSVHSATWWVDVSGEGFGSSPLTISIEGAAAFPMGSGVEVSFVAYALSK